MHSFITVAILLTVSRRALPHQFSLEPFPRRKSFGVQPLARYDARIGAFPRRPPTIWPYRPCGVSWAYEFGVPDVAEDFVPQHIAPEQVVKVKGSSVRRMNPESKVCDSKVRSREKNSQCRAQPHFRMKNSSLKNIGGGGGGPPPPPGGGDDGDGSSDDRNRRRRWTPSPKRYSTAITIGIVSILMFFMALASAFIVLRRGSDSVGDRPSSAHSLGQHLRFFSPAVSTLESARRRLFLADASGFRKFWLVTTALGFRLLPGSSLPGASLSRKACTSLATRPAVSFTFSLARTQFTFWAESAPCFLFPSAS